MSAQDIIKSIEDAQLREVAEFKTGDTVRVHAKVKEGNRERIQVFRRNSHQKTEWWSTRNIYCKKTGKWCWC